MVTPREAQALHDAFKSVLLAVQSMEGERGGPGALDVIRAIATTALHDEANAYGYDWSSIAWVVRWSAFSGSVDINPSARDARGNELLDAVFGLLGPEITQ